MLNVNFVRYQKSTHSTKARKPTRFTTYWKLAAVLVIALLATGCIEWAEGGALRPGSIHGQAHVEVGGTRFPLAGAQIVASGATNAVTSTARNGAFQLRWLREGKHTVQLRALHGTYSNSLYVVDREQLHFTVKPTGISPELFFQLSNLKHWYVDDYDRLTWRYGELVRWEKSQISVYMDVEYAPYGFDPRIADSYWRELDNWEDYLAYQYRFVRAHDAERADIVVRWVPEGSMWPEVGVARQIADYQNGSLRRVEIEIDVAWAHVPGLWEHELAQAMGLGHVTDDQSVMYPYLSGGQRTTLSPWEVHHVRLMYDIPSGQRLVGGAAGLAMSPSEPRALGVATAVVDEANGAPFSVEEAAVSGTRTHVLRVAPDMVP